jgi:hypothetical protein
VAVNVTVAVGLDSVVGLGVDVDSGVSDVETVSQAVKITIPINALQ